MIDSISNFFIPEQFIKHVVKRFFSFLRGKGKNQILPLELPSHAEIVPRSAHTLSRENISANAIKVLYRLKNTGFDALLVGGSVRDILLGHEPKDFDVVTNAQPEQIRRLFKNARLIGRRFRLVHIVYKDEIIEVSTYRANGDTAEQDHVDESGIIRHDNIYGTFAEDAVRRDFTVNSLYYNIADFSVIDCHKGLHDLHNGIIRMIGDPLARYREDPIRILRAIRLAAKLGFRFDPETENPISSLGYLLSNVSRARIFLEVEKLFLKGHSISSFKWLRHYHLLKFIFPATSEYLKTDDYEKADFFIMKALQESDDRVSQNKFASISYLLAVMLWFPFLKISTELSQGKIRFEALHTAFDELMQTQLNAVAIPRRFLINTRDIWLLQEHMNLRRRHRVLSVLHHGSFRAAFDFLRLRSQCDEELKPLVIWWQTFIDADDESRKEIMKGLQAAKRKKRKKK